MTARRWGRKNDDMKPHGSKPDPISPLDEGILAQARAYQDRLTKPPGSLGRLEELACRLCGIGRRVPPLVSRTRVCVFAADHGITAHHRVSPYPRTVTRQMVLNFAAGGAAINALAAATQSDLLVWDVGVADAPHSPAWPNRVFARSIAPGTRDITSEAAMSDEQLTRAFEVGREAAELCMNDEVHAVGLGEMGIGNTTIASALTAALIDCPIALTVGRGTGADDTMLGTKVRVIERALALHGDHRDDPIEALRCLGGFEIAAMCGLTLEAARRGIAVVTDGFIATVAVALAVRMEPHARDYVFAAHLSSEPGHRLLLEDLGLVPLLDLHMRLGEGTGAALALGLLRAAAASMAGMATFDGAGVSGPS